MTSSAHAPPTMQQVPIGNWQQSSASRHGPEPGGKQVGVGIGVLVGVGVGVGTGVLVGIGVGVGRNVGGGSEVGVTVGAGVGVGSGTSVSQPNGPHCPLQQLSSGPMLGQGEPGARQQRPFTQSIVPPEDRQHSLPLPPEQALGEQQTGLPMVFVSPQLPEQHD
ncbi:MAG: hypothetical protein ACREQQ_09245 [Candidatus Binatia bacterium]